MSLQLPSTGMRIVVQRTFIEVVEEDSSVPTEIPVKRAFSAPVTSSREDTLFPDKQKEEAECFGERLDGIRVADQEPNTTVAIRNIPPHFTRDRLLQHLDARGFAGWYDFLYLPIDFARCQTFGYAFANLTTAEGARRMLAELEGLSWGEPGEGQAVVGWSLTQGLELHIERYRNSPVMHGEVPDECKPIVLEDGVRVDFPPPTKKVQRIRRLRTRCGSRGRGVSSSGLGGIFDVLDEDAILASPLLAGLTEAPSEAPLQKKASWADLQDDHDDWCSDCSTQSPGYCSGGLSSDGSGWASPRRARGPGSSDRPWSGSMLAQGLMPSLPEVNCQHTRLLLHAEGGQ